MCFPTPFYRAALWFFSLSFFLVLSACERRAAPARAVRPPPVLFPSAPVSNEPPPPLHAPPSPWCVQALPRAEARAVDRRGVLWAMQGNQLRNEHDGSVVLFPPANECVVQRSTLVFARDGHAVALVRGRLYLRESVRGDSSSSAWVATPLCTDVEGEPWSARGDRSGWVAASRRISGRDLGLLFTEDRRGALGWYAITAMDPTITAAALGGDGSVLALSAGGHLIFVDRVRTVAGEVLAGSGMTFASLSRTAAGISIWNDEGAERVVVVGRSVDANFTRVRKRRATDGRTLRVFQGDYGRLYAVTERGIEFAEAEAPTFVSIAQWSAETTGENATFGWLEDGTPVVATVNAVVSERCITLRGDAGT